MPTFSVKITTISVGIKRYFDNETRSLKGGLLIHLRKAIVEGKIDIGILVVPSDRLGVFLTDRGPKMADAKRHVVEAKVEDLPLVLIAIEHDGPGPALAKQAKRATS